MTFDKSIHSCPQVMNMMYFLFVKYNTIVKHQGMDFREILKQKPKNLPVRKCRSKSSPVCLLNFIQSRVEQTMCLRCLEHNDLLEAHPMIDLSLPEDTETL